MHAHSQDTAARCSLRDTSHITPPPRYSVRAIDGAARTIGLRVRRLRYTTGKKVQSTGDKANLVGRSQGHRRKNRMPSDIRRKPRLSEEGSVGRGSAGTEIVEPDLEPTASPRSNPATGCIPRLGMQRRVRHHSPFVSRIPGCIQSRNCAHTRTQRLVRPPQSICHTAEVDHRALRRTEGTSATMSKSTQPP